MDGIDWKKLGEIFTDRMDADTEESIKEYFVIRNPLDGHCLHGLTFDGRTHYAQSTITHDDVMTELMNISDGFWDFVGIDCKSYVRSLDQSHLSNAIFDLNQWNGFGDWIVECNGGIASAMASLGLDINDFKLGWQSEK
jgi:hypothetical protein